MEDLEFDLVTNTDLEELLGGERGMFALDAKVE